MSKTGNVEGGGIRGDGAVGRDAGRSVPVVAVPRAWLVFLALLVIVPWLVFAGVAGWMATRERGETAQVEHVAAPPTVVGSNGPWGRLIRTPIAISPPVEYVSRAWGPVQPSVWHFPAMTGDELESTLAAWGMGRPDAARLRATARSAAPLGGLFVTPDDAMVRNLSPEARARIYLALGKLALHDDSEVQVNFDQVSSYRYYGTSIEDWLGGPRISPETRALIAPYIYRHNGFMYFADIERVRPQITDPMELQHLAKRLLRQVTMLVRLRVEDPAAIDGIVEYWGRGGRRTDLRPLLESVVRGNVEEDAYGMVDVSHLLPPIARQHLYRYPRPTVEDMQRPLLANCLWTALNFFNERPDDRYLDPQYAMAQLKSDYYLVQDGFQLGDVVAFSDARGNLFHVAVYVADDLLFSKNGTSPLAPWSILPFEHFKGHYVEYADDWRVTYHRRKDL